MALTESAARIGWPPADEAFGDCSWRPTSSDHAVVDMRGEIDAFAIPSLARCVDEAIAAGHGHVVLDLADIDFIDSSGLAAIVRAGKRMAVLGGSVSMRRPSARIRRVLDIVGLTAFVPLEE